VRANSEDFKTQKNGIVQISKSGEINQSYSRKNVLDVETVVYPYNPAELFGSPYVHIKVKAVVLPFWAALDETMNSDSIVAEYIDSGLTCWCNQTRNSGIRLPECAASSISMISLMTSMSLYSMSDMSKRPKFDRKSGVGGDFKQWSANSSPRYARRHQSEKRYRKIKKLLQLT